MKNALIYSFLLLLTAGLFSSCQERIELELNDEGQQRLVVEGWFTDQLQQQEIKLTLTSSYFSNQAAPQASDAIVTVTNGEQTWEFEEQFPGIYRTPLEVFGEPEKWYTMNVDYNGEQYEATSYMRTVAPVDSLHVKVVDPLVEFGFPGDLYYSVRLWTQELPGVGDHYMWITSVNGFPVRDTLNELTLVSDGLFDGAYVADIEIDFLEIDTEASIGDTVSIEQWNIGLEAYDTFFAILNETIFNGGIFDAPPANVQSNISNGALGYFGAAGVSTKSTVIEE